LAYTQDSLWEGTPRGLERWDVSAGKHEHVLLPGKARDERVLAVAANEAGDVWVLTATATHIWRKGNWLRSTSAPPTGAFVSRLLVRGETAWAGGPEGRARSRGSGWEKVVNDEVTALILDGTGNLWMGTSGHGLFRQSGDRFRAQPSEVET